MGESITEIIKGLVVLVEGGPEPMEGFIGVGNKIPASQEHHKEPDMEVELIRVERTPGKLPLRPRRQVIEECQPAEEQDGLQPSGDGAPTEGVEESVLPAWGMRDLAHGIELRGIRNYR